MRKTIFLIITLSISTFCFSQKAQNIKWKKGEAKDITMKLHARIFLQGINTNDSVLITKSKLTVEDVHNEHYLIRLKTYNQLINFGRLYYPDLSEKLKYGESLTSLVKIHKDSLSYEVLNRAEYEETLKSMYDTIIQIFESHSVERYDSVKIELTQLYNSLKEKSEAMHIMDLIIEAYETNYSEGDTLFSRGSIVSPINADSYISTDEKTYVNKKTKNIYEVLVDKTCVTDTQQNEWPDIKSMFKQKAEDTDTTGLIHLVQSMTNSLASTFGIEGSELFKITKNKKSRWPTEISKEAKYDIHILGNSSKIFIDVSMDIE